MVITRIASVVEVKVLYLNQIEDAIIVKVDMLKN